MRFPNRRLKPTVCSNGGWRDELDRQGIGTEEKRILVVVVRKGETGVRKERKLEMLAKVDKSVCAIVGL